MQLVYQAYVTLSKNPLNMFLAIVCACLAYFSVVIPHWRSEEQMPTVAQARKMTDGIHYSSLPCSHPPCTEFHQYTPRTLALYDGTGSSDDNKENRILLCINRKVFDVTTGRNFYGPEGPYGNFAGRDASRGMAKQSFALGSFAPFRMI